MFPVVEVCISLPDSLIKLIDKIKVRIHVVTCVGSSHQLKRFHYKLSLTTNESICKAPFSISYIFFQQGNAVALPLQNRHRQKMRISQKRNVVQTVGFDYSGEIS